MNTWVWGGVLIELLVVSALDVKLKKISNWWVIFNLGLAVLLYAILSDDYQWNWPILLYPLGWLIGGFFLFLMGIMGAGDSKFLASLFLLIPYNFCMRFLELLTYSTMVVGAVFLVLKLIKDLKKIKSYAFSAYWDGIKSVIKSEFSFAPVILLTWLQFGWERIR